MEKELKKLQDLALLYRQFGIKKLLYNETHNELGNKVSVYFASNYSICAVYFNKDLHDEINLALYSDKIGFKMGMTAQKLSKTVEKYTEYLKELEDELEASKVTPGQLKQQKIKELEEQLEFLNK